MPKGSRVVDFLTLAAAFFILTACTFSNSPSSQQVNNNGEHNKRADLLADAHLAPEPPSKAASLDSRAIAQQKVAIGQQYAAVTANPHATKAAFKVLAKGGTAVDAAIAAQMVLGLVEPQSSGLGGGGFMLVWNATTKKLVSYDGRETAPLDADENLFIETASQQPMSFFKAIIGGRSVGVPGLVKMLDLAHREQGGLAWRELFGDAITLAEQGFEVSERLHTLITKVPAVNVRPIIANYLFGNKQPLMQGYLLKNIDYAKTLKTIAEQGEKGFYQGQIAASIIAIVNTDENAGQISAKDFADYSAIKREPVCKELFEYNICGMGPPSSGATTVLSILGMLEQSVIDVSADKISASPLLAHKFIEASRLAFADRNTYIADPTFSDVPVQGLLSNDYIKLRAAKINHRQRAAVVIAGLPKGVTKNEKTTNAGLELPSTTHLSIVDQYGNIVSMTTSIETAFGSRLMIEGFILNNQLTDFSFAANTEDRQKIANRVQAGKRPTSSMSPTIVFNKNNQPIMAIGSPGGKGIITYVAKVLYETLALQRPLNESIADKHIVATGNRLRLESGISDRLVKSLQGKDHQPEIRALTSGIHALQKTEAGWLGVADPRREGTVLAR